MSAEPYGEPTSRRLCWLATTLGGLSLLLAWTLLPGCERGPEFAEVEGTVTLDGKPLPEVEVVFLPDPEQETRGPRSACYTDDDGRFHLRTDKGKDGAAVGVCRVCVVDIRALAGAASAPGVTPEVRAAKKLGGPSRVPVAYNTSTLTPLRGVEIKPGKQTIDIDVKSGRR
jgi:hypothetical protein